MKLHHLWGFTCVGIAICAFLLGCSKKAPEQNAPQLPTYKVTCWVDGNVVYQKQATYVSPSEGSLYVRLDSNSWTVDYVQGNCVAEAT